MKWEMSEVEELSGSAAGLDMPQGERRGVRPQTERGRATRSALLTSARKLFAERGYRQTQISEISSRIGVSVGTLYRYFPSKEQLLVAVIRTNLTDVYSQTSSPWVPEDPLRSIRITTERYLNLYRDNADIFRLLVETAPLFSDVEDTWNASRVQFYGRIERMLWRGLEAGTFPNGVVPAVAAVLLGGMTEHLAYINYASGSIAPSWEAELLTDQVMLLWEGMLCLRG